jgi:hypothetical protein
MAGVWGCCVGGGSHLSCQSGVLSWCLGCEGGSGIDGGGGELAVTTHHSGDSSSSDNRLLLISRHLQ